jgi:hypothetical protein
MHWLVTVQNKKKIEKFVTIQHHQTIYSDCKEHDSHK